MFVGHYGPGFAAKRLGDWTEAFQICNIHAGGRLPKMIPLPFRLSSSTSWVVLRNGLFSARAFREVGLGNAMDSQLSDDGQTGERRDKPACCRGCKSPTGKEVANPS